MKNIANRFVTVALLATAVSALALISTVELSRKVAAKSVAPPAQSNVTIFATGLNNPRGLKFGQNGNRTTFVDNLPSSQTSADSGFLVSGVADVAFIGDTLYAILSGAGCSHGVAGTHNAILRVNADGTTTEITNLSAFQQANPVKNPEPDDFEPDGTWYSMVAVRGDLYAVEPNHGEVDRISPETGAISRVIDVSASQGHIVPTTVAYHGNFFFGNLGTFPIFPGSEKVFKLTPSGQLNEWVSG